MTGGELYESAVAAGFVDCLVTAYDKKYPITSWKQFQGRHLTEQERAEQWALAEKTVNPGSGRRPAERTALSHSMPMTTRLSLLCARESAPPCLIARPPNVSRTGVTFFFGVSADDRTPNNGEGGVGGVAKLHFRGYGGGVKKHRPSAGYVMEHHAG